MIYLKILVYLFLMKFSWKISAWNLSMEIRSPLNIGDTFQINCIITNESDNPKMILYCPTKQSNSEYICFENCEKLTSSAHIFNNFKCENNVKNGVRTYIYRIDKTDESWLNFNNSYFTCEYMNKKFSKSISLLNKKGENIFLQYIDIVILLILLFISLSFNVALCSWYCQKKKNGKHKKEQNITNIQNSEETYNISTHQRKCRSLDLPQRKEMQQQLLLRNQSVLMLPYLIPGPIISPSPSISSGHTHFGNQMFLNGRKYDEQYVINCIKNRNPAEQVSSFKSAMENKMTENLTEDFNKE